MKASPMLLLGLVLSTQIYAQDIKIVGTVSQKVHAHQSKSLTATDNSQIIKLLKIQLSPIAVKLIAKRASTEKKPHTFARGTSFPSKVDLGMNNVPVLNQGPHGSCVTFAATAAIDAALNKGDYISQVCQLQLGTHLELNGYNQSGWNGSFGRAVLGQMDAFGIVNKEKQHSVGCGGFTEYPLTNSDQTPTDMSLDQFHQLSEPLLGEHQGDNQIVWNSILDVYQATLERQDTNKTLNEIKDALNNKDRVIFATLLLDLDLGTAGAVGMHGQTFDSWVMTPEIMRDLYLRPNFAGHEMVITGYDDDAIATDEQGRQHKGLLSLRNSWGEDIGDKGNFYMSYDYFKIMVIEAQRIRNLDMLG